jgi:hypothetical protein
MSSNHQPRPEFVDRLEWRLGSEVRRRHRPVGTRGWLSGSRVRVAVALTTLVIVSMTIGGAVVAMALQSENSERRDLLVRGLAQRVELASERVALAERVVKAAETRFAVGLALPHTVAESRVKLVEAQAQLRSLQLQVEEVRLTGREPQDEISAPLVSGRDFVTQRLLAEMSGPVATLEMEQARLREIQGRVEIGTANPFERDVQRSHVAEVEAAVHGLRTKLEIRRRFVRNEIGNVEAELRVLENAADTMHRALQPKVELAAKQVRDVNTKVEVGLAQPVDLAEATLELRTLEAELAKSQLDLALIRRRLQKPDDTRER